jgi:CheY-like chemotaxis protein
MMPEMNGVELIEALNDRPSLTPAATFLLTAYDSAVVRVSADRLHVKEVLTKPVHPEWICEVVTRAMKELKRSKTTDKPQPEINLNPEPLQEG